MNHETLFLQTIQTPRKLIIFSIIVITFLATLIRSTFGFGESLVAVPLLVLFIPLELAVPLSVLLSVFIAGIVVIQDHREIHLQSAKWLIGYALPGIPFGLAILTYGNEYWVKLALGLLIIGYSGYTLVGRNALHLEHDNRFWLFVCGFLSGVLGGAYGLNGPPLVMYGNMRRWNARHFRATLQAYFLPASLVGVIGYTIRGLLNLTVLKYFLLCLPASIPAIFLGRYFNRRLHGSSFFKYVYIGLILIGLLLIFFTLLGVKN